MGVWEMPLAPQGWLKPTPASRLQAAVAAAAGVFFELESLPALVIQAFLLFIQVSQMFSTGWEKELEERDHPPLPSLAQPSPTPCIDAPCN